MKECCGRAPSQRFMPGAFLKVCQFYLESPLACVSGVTGFKSEESDGENHEQPYGEQSFSVEKNITGFARAAASAWSGRDWVMTPQSRAAQSSTALQESGQELARRSESWGLGTKETLTIEPGTEGQRNYGLSLVLPKGSFQFSRPDRR